MAFIFAVTRVEDASIGCAIGAQGTLCVFTVCNFEVKYFARAGLDHLSATTAVSLDLSSGGMATTLFDLVPLVASITNDTPFFD
jgi:hypothetical protein